MGEEFEKKLIRPMINASYPGTLAALSLAVSQFGGKGVLLALKFSLLFGAMMFLLSGFFIFFYSLYPTRTKLWTSTAITFLLGLICLIVSVFLLIIT